MAAPEPTFTLPTNLPVPVDDGLCDHLKDYTIPPVSLRSTSSSSPTAIDVSTLPGLTILFCYPRTGAPGEVVPASWDAIPGARGCTPQACSFRNAYKELRALGVVQVFGLSTQSTEVQREVRERLHLPYELLSDEGLAFVHAARLPTFEWEGRRLVKRVTLALREGRVVKWWYPVFPTDQNVDQVLEWLKEKK